MTVGWRSDTKSLSGRGAFSKLWFRFAFRNPEAARSGQEDIAEKNEGLKSIDFPIFKAQKV